jgi:hypothetical protein
MGPPGDLQVQFGIRNAHALPESILRACSVANKISTLDSIQSLRDISDSLNHFPDSQIVSAPTKAGCAFGAAIGANRLPPISVRVLTPTDIICCFG